MGLLTIPVRTSTTGEDLRVVLDKQVDSAPGRQREKVLFLSMPELVYCMQG